MCPLSDKSILFKLISHKQGYAMWQTDINMQNMVLLDKNEGWGERERSSISLILSTTFHNNISINNDWGQDY